VALRLLRNGNSVLLGRLHIISSLFHVGSLKQVLLLLLLFESPSLFLLFLEALLLQLLLSEFLVFDRSLVVGHLLDLNTRIRDVLHG